MLVDRHIRVEGGKNDRQQPHGHQGPQVKQNSDGGKCPWKPSGEKSMDRRAKYQKQQAYQAASDKKQGDSNTRFKPLSIPCIPLAADHRAVILVMDTMVAGDLV